MASPYDLWAEASADANLSLAETKSRFLESIGQEKRGRLDPKAAKQIEEDKFVGKPIEFIPQKENELNVDGTIFKLGSNKVNIFSGDLPYFEQLAQTNPREWQKVQNYVANNLGKTTSNWFGPKNIEPDKDYVTPSVAAEYARYVQNNVNDAVRGLGDRGRLTATGNTGFSLSPTGAAYADITAPNGESLLDAFNDPKFNFNYADDANAEKRMRDVFSGAAGLDLKGRGDRSIWEYSKDAAKNFGAGVADVVGGLVSTVKDPITTAEALSGYVEDFGTAYGSGLFGGTQSIKKSLREGKEDVYSEAFGTGVSRFAETWDKARKDRAQAIAEDVKQSKLREELLNSRKYLNTPEENIEQFIINSGKGVEKLWDWGLGKVTKGLDDTAKYLKSKRSSIGQYKDAMAALRDRISEASTEDRIQTLMDVGYSRDAAIGLNLSKDFYKSVVDSLQDPARVMETASESLSSLMLSVKVGSIARKLGIKNMPDDLAKLPLNDKAVVKYLRGYVSAPVVGSAVLMEAASTAHEASNAVLDTPFEVLAKKNSLYRELIKSVSQEEARSIVAEKAYADAFAGMLPITIVANTLLGGSSLEKGIAVQAAKSSEKLSGKGRVFQAAGNFFKPGMGEFFQEALESGGSKAISNINARENLGQDTPWYQGVGTQAGTGAVTGFGLASGTQVFNQPAKAFASGVRSIFSGSGEATDRRESLGQRLKNRWSNLINTTVSEDDTGPSGTGGGGGTAPAQKAEADTSPIDFNAPIASLSPEKFQQAISQKLSEQETLSKTTRTTQFDPKTGSIVGLSPEASANEWLKAYIHTEEVVSSKSADKVTVGDVFDVLESGRVAQEKLERQVEELSKKETLTAEDTNSLGQQKAVLDDLKVQLGEFRKAFLFPYLKQTINDINDTLYNTPPLSEGERFAGDEAMESLMASIGSGKSSSNSVKKLISMLEAGVLDSFSSPEFREMIAGLPAEFQALISNLTGEASKVFNEKFGQFGKLNYQEKQGKQSVIGHAERILRVLANNKKNTTEVDRLLNNFSTFLYSQQNKVEDLQEVLAQFEEVMSKEDPATVQEKDVWNRVRSAYNKSMGGGTRDLVTSTTVTGARNFLNTLLKEQAAMQKIHDSLYQIRNNLARTGELPLGTKERKGLGPLIDTEYMDPVTGEKKNFLRFDPPQRISRDVIYRNQANKAEKAKEKAAAAAAAGAEGATGTSTNAGTGTGTGTGTTTTTTTAATGTAATSTAATGASSAAAVLAALQNSIEASSNPEFAGPMGELNALFNGPYTAETHARVKELVAQLADFIGKLDAETANQFTEIFSKLQTRFSDWLVGRSGGQRGGGEAGEGVGTGSGGRGPRGGSGGAESAGTGTGTGTGTGAGTGPKKNPQPKRTGVLLYVVSNVRDFLKSLSNVDFKVGLVKPSLEKTNKLVGLNKDSTSIEISEISDVDKFIKNLKENLGEEVVKRLTEAGVNINALLKTKDSVNARANAELFQALRAYEVIKRELDGDALEQLDKTSEEWVSTQVEIIKSVQENFKKFGEFRSDRVAEKNVRGIAGKLIGKLKKLFGLTLDKLDLVEAVKLNWVFNYTPAAEEGAKNKLEVKFISQAKDGSFVPLTGELYGNTLPEKDRQELAAKLAAMDPIAGSVVTPLRIQYVSNMSPMLNNFFGLLLALQYQKAGKGADLNSVETMQQDLDFYAKALYESFKMLMVARYEGVPTGEDLGKDRKPGNLPLNPELSVEKVTSAGRSGGDTGSLYIAEMFNLLTGGIALKDLIVDKLSILGRRFGLLPKDYGNDLETLVQNIANSDGTILWKREGVNLSFANKKALQYLEGDRNSKPYLFLDMVKPEGMSDKDYAKVVADQIREFLKTNNIKTLNVIGAEEDKDSSFGFRVMRILGEALVDPAKFEELIAGLKEYVAQNKPKAASGTRKTPIFDKLPSKNPAVRTMTYAGIGARQAPKAVLELVAKYAKILEKLGYVLRSGGAVGVDTAFGENVENKEIFLAKDATDQTKEIAKELHPQPDKLNAYGLALMARSTNQIFGKNLDSPVDFVLTWTPDGVETSAERTIDTGGTGQAIDMASRKGIPVFNLAKKDAAERFAAFLEAQSELDVASNAEAATATDTTTATATATTTQAQQQQQQEEEEEYPDIGEGDRVVSGADFAAALKRLASGQNVPNSTPNPTPNQTPNQTPNPETEPSTPTNPSNMTGAQLQSLFQNMFGAPKAGQEAAPNSLEEEGKTNVVGEANENILNDMEDFLNKCQ
jgi:hypothetical protein